MDTLGSRVLELPRRRLGGLVLLAVLAGVQGCVVFGRRQTDQPIVPERLAQVEKGMTKNQVTDLLGAPQEIVFSNKQHDPLREHAYIYEYKIERGTAILFGVVNFGNLDDKRDRAIVFFGDDDKVSNVAASLHGDQARFGFPFGR